MDPREVGEDVSSLPSTDSSYDFLNQRAVEVENGNGYQVTTEIATINGTNFRLR